VSIRLTLFITEPTLPRFFSGLGEGLGEGSGLGDGLGFCVALGEGDGKTDGSGVGEGSTFVVAAAGILAFRALLAKNRIPETINAKSTIATTTNLPL
jgi:hypothetical protein